MVEIRPDCIRKPSNPVVKGAAPPGGVAYKVKDGDSWESLAKIQGGAAWALIRFNYPTLPSNEKIAAEEVNWYLRWYVGCDKVTMDGKNYIFTSSANPGVIYVPAARAAPVNFSRFNKALTFMYDEMIANAKSNEVTELKALNEPDMSKFPMGPIGEPGERGARGGLVLGLKTAALLRWRELVKTNARWDHKPILRRLLNLGRDYHLPIDGDPDHEYYYDIWSNIHYGYVGRAAGFSNWELQAGHQLGGSAGANDPIDVETVQIGLDLWELYGVSLTKTQLHKAIVSRNDKLLSLQNTPAYIEAQKKGKNPNFVHIEPITNGQ